MLHRPNATADLDASGVARRRPAPRLPRVEESGCCPARGNSHPARRKIARGAPRGRTTDRRDAAGVSRVADRVRGRWLRRALPGWSPGGRHPRGPAWPGIRVWKGVGDVSLPPSSTQTDPSPVHPGSAILRSKSNSMLVIRPAHDADAAAVAAVYAPYVYDTAVSFELEAPTAAIMARRIDETLVTHPWLIADRGGDVVGYAYAGKHSQRAAYRWTADVTIYVRAQERRSGIGRSLYSALLTMLRRMGLRSAFAEIVLPNSGSVGLHEAMGFQHIGTHKDIGFKLGRWHDIGYWRLGLSEGATAPSEPIPFASFRKTSAFDEVFA